MAGENPYNELGQILASGGEVALGLALYHGWDSGKIALLIGKRLKVAPGSDQETLQALAEDAIASGEYLNSLQPGETIDPNKIAFNPSLFGDDPGGRRWRWEAEYRFGEGGDWWRLTSGEADFGQLNQVVDIIAGAAVQNENTYRAKEGVAGEQGSQPPEIRFTLAERRF